jgi:hypothetical protein
MADKPKEEVCVMSTVMPNTTEVEILDVTHP